jgi:hypothetical protein
LENPALESPCVDAATLMWFDTTALAGNALLLPELEIRILSFPAADTNKCSGCLLKNDRNVLAPPQPVQP